MPQPRRFTIQQLMALIARSAPGNGSATGPTAWQHPLPWAAHSLSCRRLASGDTAPANSSPPSKRAEAESLWTLPNMLSVARGASGLPIAYLILQEQWPLACTAVVVSGATDWLDGFLARRMGLQSVLGSYLDPLGDKVLICSVVGALAYKGLVPTWVAVVVVGRDVALVAGTLLHRWHTLGWRRVTLQEFCKTQALPAARGAGADKQPCGSLDRASRQAAGRNAYIDTGVPLMRPLMISKANTVLQLSLVAGCLGQAWVAWPDPNSLHLLELATASTTAASCLAYAHQHFSRGRH